MSVQARSELKCLAWNFEPGCVCLCMCVEGGGRMTAWGCEEVSELGEGWEEVREWERWREANSKSTQKNYSTDRRQYNMKM